MIDEVDIYSKLESALFGSLVHAVGVSSLVVHADACAIRLFDGPNGALSTFVNTAPLGINGQAEQALQEWPYQEDSVFEFVRRKQLSNDSFRPHDLQDEKNRATTKFFMPFDSIRRAIDAYCITFPVVGSAWCMIVYLRCLPSAPFAEHHINLLRQFKPAMARVTQGGYHREFHGRTAPADRHRSATAGKIGQQYKNR